MRDFDTKITDRSNRPLTVQNLSSPFKFNFYGFFKRKPPHFATQPQFQKPAHLFELWKEVAHRRSVGAYSKT